MPTASNTFQAFSPSHLVVLGLLLAFLTFATLIHQKKPHSIPAQASRWFLIILNLTSGLTTAGAHWFSGLRGDLDNLIPLHFCDVMALVGAAALLSRRPLLCEITYFLGLGATLNGLLTPALQMAYPHPVFFSFFQLHFATVATALFLPLALGWSPRQPFWKTILRVQLVANAYLLFLWPINRLLGTNFAFIMHKPPTASLFDHLGPHPWYLLTMQFLASAVMALLALPFHSRHNQITQPSQ